MKGSSDLHVQKQISSPLNTVFSCTLMGEEKHEVLNPVFYLSDMTQMAVKTGISLKAYMLLHSK